VDDPAGIDELARNLLENGIETARRFRDCGAGAVVSASDMADNSGPFFRPEQMERWILPHLAEWSERVRGMGMYTILHSDGNLMPHLDAIAGTGIDALQAVDPVAGMDMRRAMDVAGDRLCLCGNIDCGLLLRGTPAEVRDATAHLLTTCRDGGGLVLGASNAVQPEVPMANYRAMISAWREHGRFA
jgi:uroporphyrinogen decarboxylase